MPSKEISDLTLLDAPASGDMLVVVDVSDLSESAEGTNKKVLVGSLPGGASIAFRSGTGTPSNSLGADGDVYLDGSTGNLYQKASGSYTLSANLKGPKGDQGNSGTGTPGTPGNVIRTGLGVPSDGTGVDGDVYIRTSTGDLYQRSSGTYSVVANIKGPAGADGSPGTPGSTGPAGAGLNIGGADGQIPVKSGSGDYATTWSNDPTLGAYRMKMATVTPTTGAIAIDAATGTVFNLTLSGDATLTLGNGVVGATVQVNVIHGGHALAFGGSGTNAIEWTDGVNPTPVTSAPMIHYIFEWLPHLGKWSGNWVGPSTEGDGGSLPTGGAKGAVLRKNSGTDGDASFDTKGVQVDSWTSAIGTATGATPTLDFAAKGNWVVTLNANATLAFSNVAAGQRITIDVKQDASTAFDYALPGGITYDWRRPGKTAAPKPAAGEALTLVLWVIDATHVTVFVAWSAA